MSEITELAAKNEYVEARLQQAVEIIMLGDDMGRDERDRHKVIRDMNPKRVRQDMERLLFGGGDKWWHGNDELVFFQRALDIVNLPRILKSASSGVVQGTKHAE